MNEAKDQSESTQSVDANGAAVRSSDGLAGGCNCLDAIRGQLEKHHGSEVSLELKQTINTETMELGTALPPLYYQYRTGKKWKKSYVHFTFCPFCGKRAR